MSEIITSSNLSQIIDKNLSIKDEVERFVKDFTVRFNEAGVTGQDKLSFEILRKNNLIQIPIDDKHWGGAIIVKDNLKIPIINTAQPRVYQYFVAWHEVYHLLYDINLNDGAHNITADMDLNERKANCFSAQMIFGNVYNYYYSLDDENFIDKVIRCMDIYKAPYKAVLVQLFEEAVTKYNDLDLKEEILKYFDKKPNNLVQKFIDLELDSELVKPSYVTSLGGLEKSILNSVENNPDTLYHKDNLRFFIELRDKIRDSIGDFAK